MNAPRRDWFYILFFILGSALAVLAWQFIQDEISCKKHGGIMIRPSVCIRKEAVIDYESSVFQKRITR